MAAAKLTSGLSKCSQWYPDSPPNRHRFHSRSPLQMGCYVEGIAKDTVGGKDVTAHIFEYDHLRLGFYFWT